MRPYGILMKVLGIIELCLALIVFVLLLTLGDIGNAFSTTLSLVVSGILQVVFSKYLINDGDRLDYDDARCSTIEEKLRQLERKCETLQATIKLDERIIKDLKSQLTPESNNSSGENNKNSNDNSNSELSPITKELKYRSSEFATYGSRIIFTDGKGYDINLISNLEAEDDKLIFTILDTRYIITCISDREATNKKNQIKSMIKTL